MSLGVMNNREWYGVGGCWGGEEAAAAEKHASKLSFGSDERGIIYPEFTHQ